MSSSSNGIFIDYTDNPLFNQRNIDIISSIVTEKLAGLRSDKKRIVVSDCNIRDLMYDMYKDVGVRMDASDIIRKVSNHIILTVQNEHIRIENNNKLSIWDITPGAFNKHGLMPYSSLKMRENEKRQECVWTY